MSVIELDGKSYTPSKKAAELTGYAQDYIGQLARAGEIDARKISGLWYVEMDSLNTYTAQVKEGGSNSKPESKIQQYSGIDTIVTFEGKEYISSKRATELSGYSQDYVGQLARSGKILSRQVGSRWYVARKDLLAHKEYNDALLAAVQSQAVGLSKQQSFVKEEQNPVLSYFSEEGRDLVPKPAGNKANPIQITITRDEKPQIINHPLNETTGKSWKSVPIHVGHPVRSPLQPQNVTSVPVSRVEHSYRRSSSKQKHPQNSGKYTKMLLSIAFPSIFIISALGLNFLQGSQKFTQNSSNDFNSYSKVPSGMMTAAASAAEGFGGNLYTLLAPYIEKSVHFER